MVSHVFDGHVTEGIGRWMSSEIHRRWRRVGRGIMQVVTWAAPGGGGWSNA